MGSSPRRRRAPADPRLVDPAGALPSDLLSRNISVKLTPDDRIILGRCRRLLAGPEGDSYPSASRVVRLALGALYHSLTGKPPTQEDCNGTAT